MEQFLTSLLDNTTLPLVSALLLGLLTAFAPCPLATNIAAIGYISKDIENKRRVFINGLLYTAGRMFSYTSLAVVIYFGADEFNVSSFFQKNGEKFIGPLMVFIGLVMLGVLKIDFLFPKNLSGKISERIGSSRLGMFVLGILFALAFCPYSGVLYFGMLIPMTVTSAKGLYLPVVYSIASGLPVIVVAWLMAYSVSGIGKFYNNIKVFEIWTRRVIAGLFIGIGIYYIVIIFF